MARNTGGSSNLLSTGPRSPWGLKWADNSRIALEDEPWALYHSLDTASGKQQMPAGSCCLKCFDLVKRALPHMDLDEVLEKHPKADTKVATSLEEAQKTMAGDEKNFKECDVNNTESVQVNVSRSFVLLNERELQNALGRPRMAKGLTKSLGQISCRSEENVGEQEIGYLFKDPERPHRRCDVVYQTSVEKQMHQMTAENHLFAKQGEMVWTAYAEGDLDQQGIAAVLRKPDHYLYTLAEFQSKYGKNEEEQPQDSPAEGDGPKDAMSDGGMMVPGHQAGASPFSGPAAVVLKAVPPVPKVGASGGGGNPGASKRMRSSASLEGSPANGSPSSKVAPENQRRLTSEALERLDSASASSGHNEGTRSVASGDNGSEVGFAMDGTDHISAMVKTGEQRQYNTSTRLYWGGCFEAQGAKARTYLKRCATLFHIPCFGSVSVPGSHR